MGTFLGSGYCLWKPTFTLDGTTKIFQTTWMSKFNTVVSAASVNTLMRTYFCGTGEPYGAANMYIGYTLARTETYYMDGAVLSYDLDETPIVGTKASASGTPINTSIIVKKNTGIVGKRYRGRSMLPNMTVNESNISQAGILDATGLTVIGDQYTAAFTQWDAGVMDPVLGHTTSEIAPTAITSLSITPKVGSMPHRIRGF